MKNNIILFRNGQQRKEVITMCDLLKYLQGKTADELLKEHEIPMEPPIDLALLLEKIGLSTSGIDFTKMEEAAGLRKGWILGAAMSSGEDLTIFYKKSDTYNRKLFTIAHELGHCCLHSDSLKIEHVELRTDSISDKDNEHEYDANVFAGELLIPEESLMPIYKKFIVPSLKYLASIFGVSTNVMAARLDYLQLNYMKDTMISED